jgi:hypothetical protein
MQQNPAVRSEVAKRHDQSTSTTEIEGVKHGVMREAARPERWGTVR